MDTQFRNKQASSKHINWKHLIQISSFKEKSYFNWEGWFMLIFIPNHIHIRIYSDHNFLFGVELPTLPICPLCQHDVTAALNLEGYSCSPTLSSCNTWALCISEPIAWSRRPMERKSGLSEPGTGPFFKRVEFKIEGKNHETAKWSHTCLFTVQVEVHLLLLQLFYGNWTNLCMTKWCYSD